MYMYELSTWYINRSSNKKASQNIHVALASIHSNIDPYVIFITIHSDCNYLQFSFVMTFIVILQE